LFGMTARPRTTESRVGALLSEGPNRPPGVRRSDVAEITSPIRPRDRHEPGIAAAGQFTHPRNALWRFTLVRNNNASYGFLASFRPALTEARPHGSPPAQPAVGEPPGELRARALAFSTSGSPRQGPKSGLSPPISYVMLGTPA